MTAMLPPPEVSQIILAILKTGLLRVRSLAWSGQVDRCATEADHLHNLPGLLADYSEEMLQYYWDVERPSYIDQIPADQLAEWEPHWQKLRHHVEPLGPPTPAR